ncbi:MULTISPECIES: glycosyltransferase [unclassified Ensifer]|uniref:glycosyltransferase n=1 Tax=unclassified Ensifer TaxID=2633371 RepID=UPI00300FD7F0
MVSRPLISILMPTHTRVDVIGFAIESVLKQTVDDFELLVVGDGCPASTADVISGFKDDRIRFFDLPKAPHYGYANRNIALREARGRLIGFAADDDILLRDHFQLLLDCLRGGAAIAHSQALWVSADGITAPFMTNLEMADELFHFMERTNTIPASCFLYRADSLPSLDAWREDLPRAADWRLWQRIIRENRQAGVSHCRQPTLLHFSARWKRSRNSGMAEFATLLDIADSADWWPAELRVHIPPGKSEQQLYSDLLNANPEEWTRGIRQAARDLTVRLAWDDLQILRPALQAASEEFTTVQSELSSARTEIATTKTRAALAEELLATERKEMQACQAERQALNERLETTLKDLRCLTTEVERLSNEANAMRLTVAWRVRQTIARAWCGRNKER